MNKVTLQVEVSYPDDMVDSSRYNPSNLICRLMNMIMDNGYELANPDLEGNDGDSYCDYIYKLNISDFSIKS